MVQEYTCHPFTGLAPFHESTLFELFILFRVNSEFKEDRTLAPFEQEEQAGPSIPSVPSTVAESSAPTPVGTDTEDSDDALPVTSVNEVLGLVGVSPIGGKRNIRSQRYVKEKITRAEGAIRKAVLFAVGNEAMEQQDDDDDGREMIEQLKEKFTSTTSRSERLTI
ncbi:hypothetical protein EMCRGX_G022050 [Ephydatia muelleri]